MEKYPIVMGCERIGQATLEKQGLYYLISCRCRLSGETVCCVTVSSGEKTESLGVLVPEDGAFVLRRRIPVNRFGQEKPVFCVQPRHGNLKEQFIPLSPETPFPYLQRLEQGYLQRRQGRLGIVLPD